MARNPYEVLQVTKDTPDDEIRSSYREIARRYEEESLQNQEGVPPLEQRIEELNEAYDAIMLERRQAQNGPTVSTQPGPSEGANGSQRLTDIRMLIQNKRLLEANELLDGIPTGRRDGEWYFLRGTIQYEQGRLEDAMENCRRAMQMDPNNAEYQSAYTQMKWQWETGRPSDQFNRGQNVGGCSMCDICLSVYCASTCCSCFGPRCY